MSDYNKMYEKIVNNKGNQTNYELNIKKKKFPKIGEFECDYCGRFFPKSESVCLHIGTQVVRSIIFQGFDGFFCKDCAEHIAETSKENNKAIAINMYPGI